MNVIETQITREELWDQYQHEMRNEYGFGHVSMWNNGARNFIAFLAYVGARRNADGTYTLETAN